MLATPEPKAAATRGPSQRPNTKDPRLSVVIPAFNAEETLGETLDCLVAQTFAAWEAIVVDDASTDDTAAIARRYADADPRIQLVGQARGGASAARNRGMAHARAAWLLFLDADDWVAADFMEKMLAAARRKPGAGAVYCAYNRVSPDGRRLAQDWYEDLAKAPFASFARGCPPAIHSVIARRDLVVEVGGFDPSLMTCEDWDIWQKIARTGARFVELPETLAFYRMRPGSLSMQTAQMLKDGLTVSSRARGPDPRVPRPHPAFANGVPSGATEGSTLYLLCWCAGELAARGAGAAVLFDAVGTLAAAPLRPGPLARLADPTRDLVDAVFCGIAIGLSADPVRIASSWTVAARPLEDFFDRLERALARPGLSRRALQGLRLRMMNEAVASRASTRTVPVDLRRFRAIEAGPGVDTLKLDFHLGGDERAGVQLPVWGGLSARDVARAAVNTVSLRRLIGRSGIARRPGFWAAVGAETLRAAALLARAARPGSLSRKSRLKATLAAILKNAIVRSAPPSSRPDVLEAARARLGDLSGGTVEMPPAGAPNTSARLDALDPTRDPKAYFEELFREEDPWNYTNRYESLKYEQTLALLPDQPFDNAMEVACAEGHFTRMLAPKVERLLAVDISRKALERAVARCAGLDHVSFKPFDLVSDPFPTGLDLLVCSEVLYYLGDEKRLAAVAQRMAAALAPGGVLISAHAFQLSDDATRTGFDWGDAYGGETISRLFQATPGLRLERSVLTDLYAINLFRRDDRAGPPPIIEHRAHASPLDEDVERHVVWGGAAVTRARAARTERAFEAPVLMYHRIAESGPDALADYRVTPADFQAQMRLLRRHGYHAVTSRDLVDRFARGKPFHGRPVLITFDDGYQDFADHAWPVLKRNDFTAEVFLVTEKVGGRADWDGDHGAAAPLMDWETIRALAREGVNFGSHLATHRAVDTLNSQDLFDEAALSRLTLKAQLGTEVRSVAAPFGIYDDRLPYILSLCGYEAGFTTQEGRASMLHRPLHLPRIEVVGGASLDDFAKSIGLDAPMTATDAV